MENTVAAVCRYIEQHLDQRITLQALGSHLGMSPFHLQRKFKAALGITPREYTDACRSRRLKDCLQNGPSVTNAIYDAGYGSSSRVYERSDAHLGMTPATYRKGGEGVRIRYAITNSPLGRMLLAGTDRGICAIRFADSDAELEEALIREYPAAERMRTDAQLRGWADALVGHLRGQAPRLDLPLDIQATAFQRRVWSYLQTIPRGSTKSYAEVARAIGEPKATRAVARACATNPVAVAIPCHRVVRSDGAPGGYRWGMKRKQALLAQEKL